MTYLHAPDITEVAQVSFATVASRGVMRALPLDLTLDDLRDFGFLIQLENFYITLCHDTRFRFKDM